MRVPDRNRPGQAGDQPAIDSHYYTRILVGAFIFSAAINALMLSLPLYSLQVFARAIPSGNVDTLVMLTLVVVLALTMTALLEVVRGRLLSRCANALDITWRQRLTTLVVEAAACGRPDASALNDLTEVKATLTRPTFTALLDMPWTPLYVVGIYAIHPLLAVVMLAGMALLVFLGMVGHLAVRGYAEAGRPASARAQRLFDASQTKADTVKGLGMIGTLMDTVGRESMATAALAGWSSERSSLVANVTKWIRLLVQVAITGTGGWLVIEHQLSFGGMIATSMLISRGLAPIEQTAASWSMSLKSLQAWTRLRPVLARLAREPARSAMPLERERLTVENLLFVNPRDQKPILRSVSFAVEPGQAVCVLGANRTGKSVLARLLAGSLLPTAGSLRHGGLAVAGLAPADPARSIGYLPQHVDLLPGTIADNIARFLPGPMDDVVTAARRAGIHEWIEGLPLGYDTDTADQLFPFTGGTARLIALARAAYGDPLYLVLDEPTLGQDEQGVMAVRAFVADAKARAVTTIILSHQTFLADLADRTLLLKNGMAVDLPPASAAAPAGAAGAGGAGVPRPAVASWGRLRSLQASPAVAAPAT
jgi:PrtD family type I secretion system ABC transporter